MFDVLREDLKEIVAYNKIDWEKFCSSKTILITGATGLVGSFLVKSLAEISKANNLNMKILAMVRDSKKANVVFSDYLKYVSFITADLNEKITVDCDIDYIIHGASITNSKELVTNPVGTIDLAVLGTKNIYELARTKNVKSIVYLSSMEMYGKVESNNRIREDELGYIDNLSVRSCYSEGKRMVENMSVSYYSQYNLPIKIARLAQIFGAGVSIEESRVFAQFAKSLINQEDIVLHTNGESFGNYCYTKDCVLGILTILFKGNVGEAYNVVNENNSMMIKDMAKLIADMSNGKTELVFDIPQNDLEYGYAPPTKLLLSSEKINKLGWSATVDLQEMYKRLINSWGYEV